MQLVPDIVFLSLAKHFLAQKSRIGFYCLYDYLQKQQHTSSNLACWKTAYAVGLKVSHEG